MNDLAGVDGEVLDWKYSIDAAGRHWVKKVDEMTYTLDIDPNKASTAKKIKDGGQERRVNEYCLPLLNRQSTKRFLREN